MSTSSQPVRATCLRLARLAQLGDVLHANQTETAVWLALEQVLSEFYGHSLFTVLAFSKQGVAVRLYSTNTDLHPLGFRTKHSAAHRETGTWTQQVLVDGKIWRGSVREDLKAAFEDWEQLWLAGLGSVMNIPVRLNGVTIGSLNILDQEHKYDGVDLKLGILIAQIMACFVHRVSEETSKKHHADET
ncbi:unnamed protein product [Penicillium pancosmium]